MWGGLIFGSKEPSEKNQELAVFFRHSGMVQIDIACTVWPSYGKHCHRGSNPSSQHAKCRGNDAQKRSAFRLARAKHSKMICNHFSKQWQISWEACKLANPNPTAALTNPLNKKRLRIHKGLAKAESSLATQICTEKVGLANVLHRGRVPIVTSPACPCGWHRQTAKHVIMFALYRQSGFGRNPSKLYKNHQYSS